MSALLDITLPRSLDLLLEQAARERPERLEAWVFEDEAARREAERALAELGIAARIRSAYKPLLHAWLEGELALPAGWRLLLITVAPAVLQRLKVEAYPLAALLGEGELGFETDAALPQTEARVSADGRPLATLFVPIDQAFAPLAWRRSWRAGRLIEDAALAGCDYRAAYEAAMAAVAGHHWGKTEPYFEQLRIEVEIGGIERALPYDEELISTREALHEDCYFAVLEFFQRRAGRPPGDRTLRPGQIIPDIRAAAGRTRVRVLLSAPAPQAQSSEPVLVDDLAVQAAPLSPEAVAAWLAPLQGERFACLSHQGRPVTGLHRRGTKPGIVISAGQHANESSGVVGALRAVQVLQQQDQAHYALVALENPDGAALHQALIRGNPRHMHHAARYTALGDDLEARSGAELGEKAARQEAIARTGAGLHFSLHGYPAHEWTRPFAGYLPPGFEDWALPRGFFLILRRHPGRDGLAFLEALSAGLAQDPALAALNARQQRLWRAHWVDADTAPLLLNGIPCLIQDDSRSTVPFTLITEFPDETVYGEAFVLAQRTQMRTVLLGAELYWQGLLGEARAGAAVAPRRAAPAQVSE
ncbi:hypothetical protein [Roseateles cavernae]|uniref:hypothetical protein n=1 Tax=Roseateles cavernae TaxID=3153578 RepID=UPI0032E51626